EGAAEVVPKDASGRPRGARPTAKALFAAGICIPRGLPGGGGTLRQDELLASHVVVSLVLTSAVELSGLLVWSLLTSFSLPAACGLLYPNIASVGCSLMTEAELDPFDTRASSVLFPLSAITAAAPIPIPNSTEKNAVRTSRRKRGVGDKKPNSG